MNKLVNLAIILTVSVVLAGSLLVPVVTTAQDATYDITPYAIESPNSIPMSKISNGDVLTCTTENITTSSGVIEYWDDSTYYNTIIFTDTLFIWTNGTTISGGTFIDAYAGLTASSVQITVDATTITYVLDEGSPVTIPYTEGYIANAGGDYVSLFSTDTNPIYFEDTSDLSGWRVASGIVYTLMNGQGYQDGVPNSNVRVTYTDVDETDGQVKLLTGIAFGSKSLNAWILPKTAEYRHTDNPGLISLYAAIPVIFIAALVTMAAYSIRTRA